MKKEEQCVSFQIDSTSFLMTPRSYVINTLKYKQIL